MTLAGNLSDRVNTLTVEAEQVVQLREVTTPTGRVTREINVLFQSLDVDPRLTMRLGFVNIISGLRLRPLTQNCNKAEARMIQHY